MFLLPIFSPSDSRLLRLTAAGICFTLLVLKCCVLFCFDPSARRIM